MRLIYFSRDYTTHDRRFLVKLSETRHEVWYLRLEDDGIPYEIQPLPKNIKKIKWTGGKQSLKSPNDWIQLLPEFEKVIKKIQPQLIHAGPVQSCGLMTAILGFHPFIVMSWGSDVLVDAERDIFWKWMTRYTLERSDMLLCDSQVVRTKVKEIVSYEDNRIIQFPWGVDLQQFKSNPEISGFREKKGWKNNFIIISTRTWEKIYGVDILLRAFCQAYNKNSKLRLLLLGTGSMDDQINNIIVRNKLHDIVHCPGQVPHSELPIYFNSSDLYMSCSSSDGTSISLLEAMASGIPPLVTDLPGNREWISHGKNGWLAPEGNVKAFSEALCTISELEEKDLKQISNLNRKIVEERANWSQNFNKLLDAYDILEQQNA